MDGDIWVILGMVARPWSSSRLSCGERLLLGCDGNAGKFFPIMQGKDPLIHAKGSVTLLLQLGRKAQVHAPNLTGLTPLGRL